MATTSKTEDARVQWAEVPTLFVDGVLGSARANGVHRIVLGEVVHDHDPTAEMPKLRPVVNLVIPFFALPTLIAELRAIEEAVRER